MSLEANKILGAILLGGVLTMTAGYAARILTSDGHHGAHHDDSHGSGLAKVIPIPETGVAQTAVAKVEEVLAPITPLLASASVEKGEKITKKCAACHSFDEGGATKVGPNLWAIVDKPIASVAGFSYGGLAEKASEAWTVENLNGFLHKPKKWAPGTKMNYAGLKKEGDRADLIAYLQTLSN